MKNILTEALVNSATNASFIFSYTNSAKLRKNLFRDCSKASFVKFDILKYYKKMGLPSILRRP